MSEARLLYNHVVDSLPNKHDRDTIRTYVEELEQQNKVMLEFIISLAKAKYFNDYKKLNNDIIMIIESVTGKKIEEVMK